MPVFTGVCLCMYVHVPVVYCMCIYVYVCVSMWACVSVHVWMFVGKK